MRKILLGVLLICLFASAAAAEGENLLVNADLSEISAAGYPVQWYRDMWFTDAGVSELTVETDQTFGTCLRVTNVGANDARWAQDVAVEPNTVYRFSAMVRAEDIGEDGYGANLSVAGVSVYSDMLYQTDGDWVELSLVGRTGENQTQLTVFARIGGYGDENLNTGTAWFCNFSLVELSDVEAGDFALSFSTDSTWDDSQVETGWGEETQEPTRYTQALTLFIFGFILLAVALSRKGRLPLEERSAPTRWWMLALLLLAALAVRLVVAGRIPGYYTDINCFKAWPERMLDVAPSDFYAEGYFCDYPPGYILLLTPIALLRRMLGLAYDSAGYVMLLKFYPIACDLIGAMLLYRISRRRLNERAALLLMVFYAFNPATIVDSAAWGQIDAVLTLMLAICALRMIEGGYLSSLAAFAVAVLIKPQALLLAPLGLVAILMRVVFGEQNRRREIARLLGGLALSAGILWAVSLPFCVKEIQTPLEAVFTPFAWLWGKLFDATQGYKYMTVNMLNLYEALGMNWTRFADAGVWPYIAWVLFGLAYAYSMGLLVASGQVRRVFLCAGVLLCLVCTFGPMMHERYMFPALLFVLLAYADSRDRRLLISALALTTTLFMNQALVLQGGLTQLNYGHLSGQEQTLNTMFSIINVLNALFLAWTGFDICALRRVRPLPPLPARPAPAKEKDYRMGLKRLDAILMAALTLAYAVVAFVNLGATAAPQSEWISTQAQEQVTFDLGVEREFIMTYYGGICSSAFTVEFSSDGEEWTQPQEALYDQGQIFRWLWLNEDGQTDTARYVRLTADAPGLRLREVAFLDAEGEPWPVVEVSATGQNDPSLLVDEQEVVPAAPSYYNSTYFDEIYHARTAYEQLHPEEFASAYEWTHPPLGKTLMMLGIQLFGMTPFGWRFMGALMGVLMLPVMYLLVKQLTKRTDLCAIATFLLAVDSMHFTQTRIATIDSYAVFFIMVMYLFMFRYSQMRWTRDGFARSLIPLGLSGLFMGIAWATKWIGIYGSVGLAGIFAWTVWKNVRDMRGQRAANAGAGKAHRQRLCALAFAAEVAGLLLLLAVAAAWVLDCAGMLAMGMSLPVRLMRLLSRMWLPAALLGAGLIAGAVAFLQLRDREGLFKRLGLLAAFCVLMFLVVPLLIYYFSYYWQAGVSGNFNLSYVVNLQKSIFDYHAGLGGDTHYFRSEWYEWPVIAWPMWYYDGTKYVAQGMISSISCMGNPAVWWFGLAAILWAAMYACWKRRAPRDVLLVLIAFLSQYLPWVLVPRSTFIYHYFASVPFIIIASTLLLERVRGRSRRGFVIASAGLCFAALVLFIAFYPLESGTPVARSYAMLLRWFNWYNF